MKTNLPIDHFKCPLNKNTFVIKDIREWVEKYCEGKVLNLFAGKTILAVDEIRNDLNVNIPADFHMDALNFVKTWKGEKFDTVILDSPYSQRKSMEMYEGIICSPFKQLKDEIPRILNLNGIVITFGYHMVSLGKVRGFVGVRGAVFSHGGAIHDTIAIIERKIQ